MPSAGAITPQTESILDKPHFYPIRLVAKPLLWVVAKIRGIFQIIFGYLIRIGVFSFGEWNRSFIKRKIIELYKGGCYDTHDRLSFDPLRLEQAFAILENIGGIRYNTHSKDGTKLDAMIIRYQDVKAKIEEHGGKIVDAVPISINDVRHEGKETLTLCRENHNRPQHHVDMILPDKPGEKWDNFYEKNLLNLGLEKADIELKNGERVDGFILNYWDDKKPLRPKQGQCFVRCNAPTESYPMAKRDIMRRVLGIKNDVLCFDYRGTWKSEGVPSEGGYYLDAETMVEQAANEFGYDWKDIWADGFCLGGGVAMHLKRKYHDKGINVFVQNTFDTMLHTLQCQVFPSNLLAKFGINEIRSRDPYICAKTEQDSFNSVGKLKKLRNKEKQGVSIVYNTDTDTTIDKRSYPHLAAGLDRVSKKTFSVFFNHPNKKKNGHSDDIFSYKNMWKTAVTLITAKDYPEILERTPTRWWNKIPSFV